ncbi:Protein of unknown function [Pyronema omphalodes CBS 100304]|uniref:Uncharacterized protein n=1 Tax=Pyronema omphalodes (strain CBS 100304) TaxID=1076935 RepID=U4L6K8_PYROM|nr:Protein of unknown function [Pyronema omphalodes CBS 100304]
MVARVERIARQLSLEWEAQENQQQNVQTQQTPQAIQETQNAQEDVPETSHPPDLQPTEARKEPETAQRSIAAGEPSENQPSQDQQQTSTWRRAQIPPRPMTLEQLRVMNDQTLSQVETVLQFWRDPPVVQSDQPQQVETQQTSQVDQESQEAKEVPAPNPKETKAQQANQEPQESTESQEAQGNPELSQSQRNAQKASEVSQEPERSHEFLFDEMDWIPTPDEDLQLNEAFPAGASGGLVDAVEQLANSLSNNPPEVIKEFMEGFDKRLAVSGNPQLPLSPWETQQLLEAAQEPKKYEELQKTKPTPAPDEEKQPKKAGAARGLSDAVELLSSSLSNNLPETVKEFIKDFDTLLATSGLVLTLNIETPDGLKEIPGPLSEPLTPPETPQELKEPQVLEKPQEPQAPQELQERQELQLQDPQKPPELNEQQKPREPHVPGEPQEPQKTPESRESQQPQELQKPQELQAPQDLQERQGPQRQETQKPPELKETQEPQGPQEPHVPGGPQQPQELQERLQSIVEVLGLMQQHRQRTQELLREQQESDSMRGRAEQQASQEIDELFNIDERERQGIIEMRDHLLQTMNEFNRLLELQKREAQELLEIEELREGVEKELQEKEKNKPEKPCKPCEPQKPEEPQVPHKPQASQEPQAPQESQESQELQEQRELQEIAEIASEIQDDMRQQRQEQEKNKTRKPEEPQVPQAPQLQPQLEKHKIFIDSSLQAMKERIRNPSKRRSWFDLIHRENSLAKKRAAENCRRRKVRKNIYNVQIWNVQCPRTRGPKPELQDCADCKAIALHQETLKYKSFLRTSIRSAWFILYNHIIGAQAENLPTRFEFEFSYKLELRKLWILWNNLRTNAGPEIGLFIDRQNWWNVRNMMHSSLEKSELEQSDSEAEEPASEQAALEEPDSKESASERPDSVQPDSKESASEQPDSVQPDSKETASEQSASTKPSCAHAPNIRLRAAEYIYSKQTQMFYGNEAQGTMDHPRVWFFLFDCLSTHDSWNFYTKTLEMGPDDVCSFLLAWIPSPSFEEWLDTEVSEDKRDFVKSKVELLLRGNRSRCDIVPVIISNALPRIQDTVSTEFIKKQVTELKYAL